MRCMGLRQTEQRPFGPNMHGREKSWDWQLAAWQRKGMQHRGIDAALPVFLYSLNIDRNQIYFVRVWILLERSIAIYWSFILFFKIFHQIFVQI